MPQVNTIAIDIAPSNDFSSVQSGATSSSKNSNKDFSQVIEQHYQSQQTKESGKKQETSGNKSKLDTEVQPEKENVQGKRPSHEVQSPKNETGTEVDNEVNKEVTEKSHSGDKDTNEKVIQSDNAEKKPTEKKDAVSIDVNNAPLPTDKIEDSAQQLMSLLSASDKILTGDLKGVSKETPIDHKKLSKENVDYTVSEKTELDALLKQVLGGNNKKELENKIVAPDDKLGNIKIHRPIIEPVKPSTEAKSQALTANIESKVKPTIEGDESIKGENKLDLSVLIGKNAEDGESSSIKTTDAKNTEGAESSTTKTTDTKIQQLIQTNKETQAETANRIDRVVDKSGNESKQQMLASELEALAADMESTTTESELEKIKADLIGNQDKPVTLDKSTQNNAKTDNSVLTILQVLSCYQRLKIRMY